MGSEGTELAVYDFDVVLGALRSGCDRATAAHAAGFPAEVLEEMVRGGQELLGIDASKLTMGELILRENAQKVLKAEAGIQSRLTQVMLDAAEGGGPDGSKNWRAAQALLQIMRPDPGKNRGKRESEDASSDEGSKTEITRKDLQRLSKLEFYLYDLLHRKVTGVYSDTFDILRFAGIEVADSRLLPVPDEGSV